MKHIGVFCASRDDLHPAYIATAEALGQHLAARGDALVYGGGSIGLMGVIARTVHAHGGTVIGVIPQRLLAREVGYREADELIISRGMDDRKQIIMARADGFLILPGGFGTMDELFEVLTLKQLGYHQKPIVLLNVEGFFDPLLALFEHLYATGTAYARYRGLYTVCATLEAALAALDD